MRSFYIACVILLVIIALIIVNSYYVENKVNELLILCQKLDKNESGSSLEILNELIHEWEKCRDKLSLSINHSEIDRAESALFQLASFYARGEQSYFLAQLEVFKSAIRHIAHAQALSLDNIL